MSAAALTHEFTFTIPATHPSLTGHFPGNPIVPGVLVLDEVLSGSEQVLGAALRVAGIPQVKFVNVLRPEQAARVRVEYTSTQLRFSVRHGDALLAQGVFVLRH